VIRASKYSVLFPLIAAMTAQPVLSAPPEQQTDTATPSPLLVSDEPSLPESLADPRDLTPVETVSNFADALALSYSRNPRLLAERAQTRSADNQLPAARGAYGPHLDVRARHSYQRDRAPGLFFDDQGFSTTAEAVLVQPVHTFGRLRSAEEGALARISFSRASLRYVENQTLLDTINSYVAVQRDEALVAITRENVELLERQLSDNRERFRVREITSTDLQQIQTRVEFGRAQLLDAEGTLAASRSTFLRMVGANAGKLDTAPRLMVPVSTLDEAQVLAERDSPLIAAAEARERNARASTAAAQAEFFPEVALQGTGEYGTISPYRNTGRTTRLVGEVVVTVPLIDSGVRLAKLRAARETEDAEWRLADDARRETRDQVNSAWNRLAASRQSITHYSAAVDAAQLAYDGAAVQERAGARTTLDVLDLARDLLTVKRSYIQAIADEYVGRATLLASLGHLEGDDLLPGKWLYDPETNLKRVKYRGNFPPFSSILSALDGVTVGDMRSNKPSRDPSRGLPSAAGGALGPDIVPPISATAPASR